MRIGDVLPKQAPDELGAQCKTVTVTHGDSLWTIARRELGKASEPQVRDYVDDIKRLNGLSGAQANRLTPGQVVKLPLPRVLPSETNPTATAQNPPLPPQKAPNAALLAVTPPAPETAARSLTKSQITILQRGLNLAREKLSLKFDVLKADGKVGPLTIAGVALLRENQGAKRTGEPCTADLMLLDSVLGQGWQAAASAPHIVEPPGWALTVLDQVSSNEGSRAFDYGAFNANDAGYGVSWGFIQFQQKVGGLPELLVLMQQASPTDFARIFAEDAEQLLSTDWVKDASLNTETWKHRFAQASGVPEFQQAQRFLAWKNYVQPASTLANKYGISNAIDTRALYVLADACVQCGEGAVRGWLSQGGEAATPAQRLINVARQADVRSGINRRLPYLQALIEAENKKAAASVPN